MKHILFSISLLLGIAQATHAQFFIDAESGLVAGTPYNTVRIPNKGGTTFNIAKDLTIAPKVFYRLRLGYTIADRHTISVLYAPLTVQYEGAFSKPVTFNGQFFLASQPIKAAYRFNSYRLTYRYDFITKDRFRVGLGLTAKIRDADIQLAGDDRVTHYDNVGFVPLINFYASYNPATNWRIILEGDALGAKQGRAEDIFLGAAYQLTDKLGLKAGYRVVEGGADTDEIYNFTWINYASVGVLFKL